MNAATHSAVKSLIGLSGSVCSSVVGHLADGGVFGLVETHVHAHVCTHACAYTPHSCAQITNLASFLICKVSMLGDPQCPITPILEEEAVRCLSALPFLLPTLIPPRKMG